MLNDSGMTFLRTRSLTEESAKAGKGIIESLEEALVQISIKRFKSLIIYYQKDSMFSNFVSGFAAVVNEIKEGGLEDYSTTSRRTRRPIHRKKSRTTCINRTAWIREKSSRTSTCTSRHTIKYI